MKKFLAAGMISLMSFSASAGSITYEAPQNMNIEIEPSMNVSFANWLIPAVIVAVLILTATSTTNTNQQ